MNLHWKTVLVALTGLSFVIVGCVGPDIQHRARLIKDLPSGVFAGEKLPPKVDEKTLIQMSLSISGHYFWDDLKFRSIDLDFSTGTFQLSGWMQLDWEDQRYTWHPQQYGDIETVPLPFSKTWAPDVMLYNGVDDKFMFRQIGVLSYTGGIRYIIAVHTKSACSPNYGDFPWGVQLCSLKFGSWINNQYNVEYRLPTNSTIGLNDFESTVGWKIVNTKARLQSVQHPLAQEPTHIVVYDIAFKRETYFDGAFGVLRKENGTTEL